MRRRSSSISDNVPYLKPPMYFRVAQMILCLVCLILAILFWNFGHMFVGATVVLFATSFGFFVITVIDVLASLRRKQYTAPVWVGLAFLAAFMCFLSFGFMLFQSALLNMMIGIVFAITGIVFLIDGIILIVRAFESNLLRKVHPISEEKPETQTIGEPVQVVDDVEIIEEVPVEARRIAPVGTARRKSSFPITSYGGTFPVGGSDAPPLPTPDNLTGIEPAIPAQLYVPKRNTLDNSPRTHSISSERTSIDDNRNLYPSTVDGNQGGGSLRSQHDGSRVLSELSQQMNLTNYSSSPTRNASNDEPVEGALGHTKRVYPQHHPPSQQHPPSLHHEEEIPPGLYLAPCQAAGDQQPNVEVYHLPFDARYQRDNVSCRVPECQCCATRAYNPAEQITPFVTHHYSQSPCTCGYTHYHASTVVKGAVKQYPQNTMEQQQRIIEEQLEQMRENQMYHGCPCHDKARQERKVSYEPSAALDFQERDQQSLEQPTDISTSLDYRIMNEEDRIYQELEFGSVSEGGSNESVFRSASFFEENDEIPSKRLSLTTARNQNLSDQDKSMNRKVTIGNFDVISPSRMSNASNASKYRRWVESLELDQLTKDTKKTVNQVYSPNIQRRTLLDKHGGYDQQRPPLDTIGEDLQEQVENNTYNDGFGYIQEPPNQSRVTILSEPLPVQENADQTSEHDLVNKLGSKTILDSYVLIKNKKSTEVHDTASQSIPTNQRSIHFNKNNNTHSQKHEQASSSRKQSYNEYEQRNVSEDFSCPCKPDSEISLFLNTRKTWSSEAREAEKPTEIAAPLDRSPKMVCHGLPPKCLCCPRLKEDVLRSSVNFVKREEERRASLGSHGLSSHRSVNEESFLRENNDEIRSHRRMSLDSSSSPPKDNRSQTRAQVDDDEMRRHKRISSDGRGTLPKDDRNQTIAPVDNDEIRSHKRISSDSRSTLPKDNINQTRASVDNDEISRHKRISSDRRSTLPKDNRNQTRPSVDNDEIRRHKRISSDSRSTLPKDERNQTRAPLNNDEIRKQRRLSLDSRTESLNYNNRDALENQTVEARSVRHSSTNSRNIPPNSDIHTLENQIEGVLTNDEIKSQIRYSLQSTSPNYKRNTLENQIEETLNNDETMRQRSQNSRNVPPNYRRNTLENQNEETLNNDEMRSRRSQNYRRNTLENQIEETLNNDETRSQRSQNSRNVPPDYRRNTLENQIEETLNDDEMRSRRSQNYRRNTLENQIEEAMNTDEIKSQRRSTVNNRSLSPNKHRNMQENYSVLPRMLDPIQEQRLREEVHLSDSAQRISHIPPHFDGFPTDRTKINKKPCVCKCICKPRGGPKDLREVQEAPGTNKYFAVPLNQQPYHPKDDFRMMPNPFTDFGHRDSRLEDPIGPSRRNSSKGENSQKSNQENGNRYRRSTQRSTTLRNPVHRISREYFDAQERECLEQCPSCPVRRRRLEREAELMEEMNFRDRSRYFCHETDVQYCIPKRAPLKRSYPEERK